MSLATNFYVPHPRDDRISWTSIDAGHLIKRLWSAATGGSAPARQITPMISRPVLDQAASNDPALRGILNGADPQSVQYAIYLFSEVVERRMAGAGAKEEAELVALIRKFFLKSPRSPRSLRRGEEASSLGPLHMAALKSRHEQLAEERRPRIRSRHPDQHV